MADAETLEQSRAQIDRAESERRIARGVAVGLPVVTIAGAVAAFVVTGPATSILVIAAGLLLGVIALLWGSIRILTGDAPLSPELAAMDMATEGEDALATRRKMLLRALKDIENERAIGRIEDEDYEQISMTYREELKSVLKRIDEALAPHRAMAEAAARAHLAKSGLDGAARHEDDAGPRPATRRSSAKGDRNGAPSTESSDEAPSGGPSRVKCRDCGESNEPDAKFCKGCAAKLRAPEVISTSDAGAGSPARREETDVD